MAKEPQYAMWEYWSRDKKGVPVSTFVPARWMPGEAWALIDGAWQRVNDADVGNEARLLDKEAYESYFGATLIALPATSFQR